MDIAIHQETRHRGAIANATQLYQAAGRAGSLEQATRGFLDRLRALSKGNPVSRAAAFCLGAAIVFVFGTSPRAADLIGQVPLQTPPSVAAPFDWTGAYFGGHVGYAAGWSDWSTNQFGGFPSVGRTDLTNGLDVFKGTGSFFGGLQGGYNLVLPSRLMLGLEADVSFPNSVAGTSIGVTSTGIASYGDTVLHSGTVRGRVGYVFDNSWLVYGTGGFAWSYDQIARTNSPALHCRPGQTRQRSCGDLAGRRVRAWRCLWRRAGARAWSIFTRVLTIAAKSSLRTRRYSILIFPFIRCGSV